MRADHCPNVIMTVAAIAMLVWANPTAAQMLAPDTVPGVTSGQPLAAGSTTDVRDNPFARRPQCASMFLKADWQLTFKQRTCDWVQNRLFSTNALLGAAWSAGSSTVLDRASEAGDGFTTRFGRKVAQNAFKSTGSYLGALVFREDPRTRPPYLTMQTGRRPRGFLKRTARAIGGNLIAYRCDGGCTTAEDIRRVPALSRIVGSVASGAASGFWEAGGQVSGSRALRGAASAYGSTFVNAVLVEFKPELSAAGNKIFRGVFGGR